MVREGGHLYYVNDLVPGRAEGTLVAGEALGSWAGGAAETLGLRGTVEARPFADLLDGRDPVSGGALRSRSGERSVAAYDLTFCAPKSVSLLHLLAPRELAGQVGAGHRVAVDEAMGYLEREAVGVRRSRGGQVVRLASTGAVAGTFVHRTSRALDPHLHTHVVVANVAQGVDGAWSAVDSRRIYAHLAATQGIYHARLRLELTGRFGAGWEVGRTGLGDVVGVDGRMRHLFSQRSAAMDEYLHRRGRPERAASRVAAYHATRPDKDRAVTVDTLLAGWRQRAAEFGFDLGDLTRVVGMGKGSGFGVEIDRRRVSARMEELSRGHRSLAHRDLVAVVSAASTGGSTARVIESVATSMAGVAGPPVALRGRVGSAASAEPGTGRTRVVEQRWDASELARGVEAHPEVLRGEVGHRQELSTGAEGIRVDRGRTGHVRSRSKEGSPEGRQEVMLAPGEVLRLGR